MSLAFRTLQLCSRRATDRGCCIAQQACLETIKGTSTAAGPCGLISR